MIALEITINGKKIVLAGAPSLAGGVTSVVKAPSPGEPVGALTVFGITEFVEGEEQLMLNWKENHPVSVGDEIRICIKEVSKADPPESSENPAHQE